MQVQQTQDETATIDNEELQNDINEYMFAEKRAMENFLNEMIKLGEILSRQRDKWKPKKLWYEYISKIGKNNQTVNQMIRVYTLAKEDMEKLVSANINTWTKLQSYLSLDSEQRDKFIENVDSGNLNSSEYAEKVDEIKEKSKLTILDSDLPTNTPDVVEAEIEVADTDSPAPELKDWIKDASLTDVYFMAKELLKTMNKVHNNVFTSNSIPLVEAFLFSEKINRSLSDKILSKLSQQELHYWVEELKASVNNLQARIKSI